MQPLWRTVWRFLKKLKIELPYGPAMPLLCIYLEKNIIWKNTCTPIFTETLFTIAKTWKQPKCPLTEEWIKKMWYRYTMEYHSTIKKNEIMPFVATWMDPENVTLNEVSQRKKNIWHPLYAGFKKKWYKCNYLQNRKRLREPSSCCGVGGRIGGRVVREFGMDMYTLLYLKWITNKFLSIEYGALLNVM